MNRRLDRSQEGVGLAPAISHDLARGTGAASAGWRLLPVRWEGDDLLRAVEGVMVT
jgi:hypothetical protein